MTDQPIALEVIDLSFDYHGVAALSSVSFKIAQAERVGLVGPNGAGKSTLMLLLNGLLSGQGTIKVNQTLLSKKTIPQIRRQVGLVFPDAEDQLFMPTVEQDVAFGPLNMGLTTEQAEQKARDALDTMGLAGLAERSSHHLSDGERRRAAIATVLSMKPDIWVLDEPGANLDPQGRRELISILQNLPGTVLLASHDLDLVVQVCQRCLLLDGGQMIAEGPTQTVLADRELMEGHGLEVPLRIELQSGTREGNGRVPS